MYHRRGVLNVECTGMEQRIEGELRTLIEIISAAAPRDRVKSAVAELFRIDALASVELDTDSRGFAHSRSESHGIDARYRCYMTEKIHVISSRFKGLFRIHRLWKTTTLKAQP